MPLAPKGVPYEVRTRRAVELRRDRQTWACQQCEEVQKEDPPGPEVGKIAAARWKRR